MNLQILVADDHDLIRRGIRAIIDSQSGWKLCGEAKTGTEAIEKSRLLKPDIVVLDVNMPEVNGIEAAKEIKKASPKTEILMLSFSHSEELIRSSVNAGARGYILKSDASVHLVSAVETLAQGKPFFGSNAIGAIMSGSPVSSMKPPSFDTKDPLTQREREIIVLLCEGKNSGQVGEQLNITTKTVDTHRANIMRKLQLHTITDLVRYAVRNGIAKA